LGAFKNIDNCVTLFAGSAVACRDPAAGFMSHFQAEMVGGVEAHAVSSLSHTPSAGLQCEHTTCSPFNKSISLTC
jgi:hypothetical protein